MLKNLVVELELRDGKYRASMLGATAAADKLGNSFSLLNAKVKEYENSTSAIEILKATGGAAMAAHYGLSFVNNTAGELTRSLIQANSALEKTGVLLKGLSQASTESEKIKEVGNSMKFLLDTAKQAPFSLKEISNSFVKMKSVGIGDVEQKVRTLSNAISNFGGDDQSMHRATVAIQQMVSKGVVSMEELRQQLGESVPGAMQAMADGMGVTMQSLIKEISKGKVKAIPAIEGMMAEMESSMAGASARMMNTWEGMTSQLATNWMIAQKQIGDAGAFEAAKEEIGKLNEFLKSEDARAYAHAIGDGLASAIKGFETLRQKIVEDAGLITGLVFTMGKFAASMVAFDLLKSGFGSMVGAGSLASQAIQKITRSHEEFVNSWRTLGTVTTQVATTADFATGRISGGIVEITKKTGTWTKATQLVGASLNLLAGPIGVIGVAIVALASNFIDFGNEAEEAITKVIDKQKELNALKTRTSGDEALQSSSEVEASKKSYGDLIEQLYTLEKRQANYQKNFGMGSSASIDKEIANVKSKMQVLGQAIAEGMGAVFERENQRAADAVRKSIDKEISDRASGYKKQVDLINKMVDKTKEAGASEKEANAIKHAAMLELRKKEVDEEIKIMESLSERAKADREDLAKRTPVFKSMFDSESILEEQRNLEAGLILGIEQVKDRIKTAANESDKAALLVELTDKQNKLGETATRIKSISDEINKLKQNGGVKDTDLFDYNKIIQQLKQTKEELAKFGEEKEKLNKGVLPGDGAFITEDVGAKSEKAVKKAEQAFSNAKQKLADRAATFLETQSKTYDKFAAKSGLQISVALEKSLQEAANNIKYPEDLRKKFSDIYKFLTDGAEDSINGKTADEIVGMAQSMLTLVDSIDTQTKHKELYNRAIERELETKNELLKIDKKLININNVPFSGNFKEAERKYGVSADTLAAFAKVESGFDPLANSKNNRPAKGLMQFIPQTAKQYGLQDRYDPSKSIDAAARLMRDNQSYLAKVLGRMPTPGETYLAHQQGMGGAAKLIQNPDTNAAQVVGRKEVLQNGGSLEMTAREFASIWTNKIDALLGGKNRTGQSKELSNLYEERDAAKNAGQDTSIIDSAIQVQKQQEAEKELLEGKKKTAAEYSRIHALQVSEQEKKDEFLATTALELDSKLLESKTRLQQDNASLYKQDTETFLAEMTMRAQKNNVVLDKEKADFIKNVKEKYEAAKRAVEDYDTFLKTKENDRQAREGSIGRASGTAYDKDLLLNQEKYRQIQEDIISGGQAGGKSPEKIQDDLNNAARAQAEALRDLEYQHRNSFQKMMQDTVSLNQVLGDAGVMGINGIMDGFAKLATEGTASFSAFAASVARDIAGMLAKMAALAAMQQVVGMIGGAMSPFNGTGPMQSFQNSSSVTGGLLSGLGSMFGSFFADGGTTVSKYADGGTTRMSTTEMEKGGVKNSAHVAVFGEAGVPEAFIPMRDRKTIPISVSQGKNGEMSAKALLPGGNSIPAKVVDTNMSAYANGGIQGAIKSDLSLDNSSFTDSFANVVTSLNQASIRIGSMGSNMQSIQSQQGGLQADRATNVNITINPTVNGKSSDQDSQNGGDAEVWQKMSQNVKAVVLKTISEESRPGGRLYK
jgi:tape measure domain-containing protein